MNAPVVPRPRRAVRREHMSDEVAGHLRAAIMSGALPPGTFIRLDETAARLGVSITPVREALRTLRGEGMVLLEPHRGHVVAPLSRQDVEDIYWLQATIAEELTAAAAAQITDEQIAELERLNDEFAAAVETGDAADPQWAGKAVKHHRRLIAALRRRDAGEAARLVEWKFADGARQLTARLEKTGIWR